LLVEAWLRLVGFGWLWVLAAGWFVLLVIQQAGAWIMFHLSSRQRNASNLMFHPSSRQKMRRI
jgi:hypothetical protein